MKFSWISSLALVSTVASTSTAEQGVRGASDETIVMGAYYSIMVRVKHDDYPQETAWKLSNLKNGNIPGNVLAKEDVGTINTPGHTNTKIVQNALPGDYIFDITDVYGDGICCGWGLGNYEIIVNNRHRITKSGKFASVEKVTFRINPDGTIVSPVPGPNLNDKVDFKLQVTYDQYAYMDKTLVKVERVRPQQVVEVYPVQQSNANSFKTTVLHSLIPGEEYKVIIQDDFGDGMPGGEVDVAMYVNDVHCDDLVRMQGDDPNFQTYMEATFVVPHGTGKC
mmetsp:Transcript_17898/g.34032  ORF Transcript_17898/g.34032 Transcript_17898/m.34032 type:complete len:280 (+) Transcript_17898:858-1697(+)|eukprot:scaffold8005_cov275-Amphora_coffeaeformis.AAC.8